jgi:hypothetical protein
MKKFALFMALLVVASAFAADMASAPAPDTNAPVPHTDAATELKWDNGTGAGAWVGNDFNVSTLTCYKNITSLRLSTRSGWPNATWEGGRMGVYAFAGGVPGSLLWGPSWFLPTAAGWQDFAVNYNLASGTNAVIMAIEQYYNNPTADAFNLDSNPTFMGHSWQYYSGSWSLLSITSVAPYRNIMLRCMVDQNSGVAPASVGRIKAIYY